MVWIVRLALFCFEDLKLTPSPNVTTIDKNWENISKEILPDLDADAIFVLVSSVDEGSDQVFEKLQSDPIWLGLKAVKNKQIYMITEQPWLDYSASGNLQALEQLEKMLNEK
ncbi:ABC-type Fe3+-hydroxamate transport system substrate-binding protein [Paenibacillus sp. SORGH_AS338]|uniref:ABC transporter substrate-binding protein n=1 Tax=Paenibacillus sp. SORGH_AS_0338 TaxID=3041755 RepID=UPI00285E06E3|nr:ABC transporter substrate-binding protein [Paenibacillus sp. SORGH_AS_0338]MDR6108814.1 ABC-type Fe3+-hydroxamate transport system substrate-binding protein [Paenibacillus sp. SORGH_AS_0338]